MKWSNTLKNFINSKKVLLLLGFILLSIYLLPYFMYGSDVYISVFDNLDSNVVWFKILANSGLIFADSMEIIPNMMGGIPRLSYGSEFNVILWLYYFFDDFTAYVINDVFIHMFAFISMFVLLNKYFIDDSTPNKNFIVFTTAILFAMVPFWPSGGLSVAGQPLVLWAFLNIRNNQFGKVEWIILGLIPFYSSFVLVMFFVLFAITLIYIYDLIKTKKVNSPFLAALIFMTSIFLFVEYRLVQEMLIGSDYISHREDFVRPTVAFTEAFFDVAKSHYLIGYQNAVSLQATYLIPFILFTLVLTLLPKSENKVYTLIGIGLFLIALFMSVWMYLYSFKYFLPTLLSIVIILAMFKKEYKQLYWLIILQIVMTYYTEIWFYDGIKVVVDTFPFVEKFNFSRVTYLQPILWYIILGSAFVVVANKYKFIVLAIFVLLVLQTSVAFDSRLFTKANSENLNYKNYYAKEQFDVIKQDIGHKLSSFRVASIGMDPVIAVYNGFYTIDGYSANYPVAYKHRFRKLYSEDVTSDPQFIQLFDQWGSKCYIYDKKITYSSYSKGEILKDLDLNMSVLQDFDVKYIISPNQIKNSDKFKVQLIDVYGSEHWFWDLYLYSIKY